MVMQLLSLEGKYSSLVETVVMVVVTIIVYLVLMLIPSTGRNSLPSPHHGPMMKRYCGMVAVQLEEEAYLVVIGGSNDTGQQSGTQRGAQYESSIITQCCNEIHYYKLSSGQYN